MKISHINRKILTRVLAFMLAVAVAIPTVAFAAFPSGTLRGDGFILTDPVANTYTGRPLADRLINQLQFTDLPENPNDQDAIIRGAAMEIFRPDTRQFRPDAPITREEAIAYALRAAGLSEQSREIGRIEAAQLPPGSTLGAVWSFGYLQLAQTIGLITEAELNEALGAELVVLDDAPPEDAIIAPQAMFRRNEPATREEIASWIVGALEYAEPTVFAGTTSVGLGIQTFTDWNDISSARVPSIETLMRHNILHGQSATIFGPTGNVSRQEMAHIARNIDRLHHNFLDLERFTGTVAVLTNEQYNETSIGQVWRHVFVRRANGEVDLLQYSNRISPSPQDGRYDAVVLRDGEVTGITSLQAGDIIEYIVHPETGTVWYINVTGGAEMEVFRGRLEIINFEDGTMTFRATRDGQLHVYTFPMAYGLFGTREDGVNFIRFSNELFPVDQIPRGTYYDVYLVANVITDLIFVGDPVLVPEMRGIVIENNPFLGSLTILDQNRMERSFTYVPGQLRVQRREFFDDRSIIGGIHQIFPSPNLRETDIAEVIAGDIVVFRVADDDPFRIISISAAENTTTRYGRIREFRDQGGHYDFLMEFDNGRTSWFTFVDGILVLSHGRPVQPNQIQVGDWARIIVNQAAIAPGIMMESVREVAIDGGGHHISQVIMGQLAGFNAAQNQLNIQHAQTLGPAGWSDHRPLASFNIGTANVEYFFDGRQVTLAYMNRHLQRSDATVYLALEDNFAGERVRKVSVRSGRNQLLRPDEVLSASNNSFMLLENDGHIATDPGTIVVRNGRLVDHGHIFAPDWATVSLNGQNTAAVVDIGAAPATSGVQIARGRVSRVWPHESFRVETMSTFDGTTWNFTPIAREFTIDHDTIFINDGGVTSINDFLGFGDDSVIGDVFNVVIEGGRVSRVIDAPFTEPVPALANAPGHLTMRGVIYEISGTTVSLRDVHVFNGRTGQWGILSNTNATSTANLQANTLIVDRNQLIGANGLRVGQQIKVFSDEPRPATVAPGISADVFIVLVES